MTAAGPTAEDAPHATVTAALSDAIAAAVAPFGRVGIAYPLHLVAPDGAVVVAVRDYLQPDAFRDASTTSAQFYAGEDDELDLRAGASRLMRRYCGSFVVAALAPLAAAIGLDVSIDRASVIIRDDLPMGTVIDVDPREIALASGRPAADRLGGIMVDDVNSVRARVFRSLFEGNFGPAIDAVLDVVHLSRRLLWCTVAEQIDVLYDAAIDHMDAQAYAPLADDRRILLEADVLPGVAEPNPLPGLLEWETFSHEPRPVHVRRVCCACMVMPDRPGQYCRTCNLVSHEQRGDLWQQFRAGALVRQ